MATIKSIEEKARRYDKALERANKLKETCDSNAVVGWMEYIFPELKESEDERIMKEIIDIIDSYDVAHLKAAGLPSRIPKYIAWLEKQGGHAKFINGIQVGDKVTRNEDGVLVNLSQLNRVANKQGEQKLLYVNDNAKEMFIKALECVEEQNNKGYKLTDCDKNSWWEDFKAYTSCIIEQKPAEYNKEIPTNLKDIVDKEANAIWKEESTDGCHLVIDSFNMFYGICMQIAEAVVDYKKPTWSEEDEKQARQIERIVHDDGCTQKLQKQIADWFESLKERYTWKPSDEQMDALYYVTNFDYGGHKATLVSLYEQLKKLKA